MTMEAVQQQTGGAGAVVVNADPLMTAEQAGQYLGLAGVHKNPAQAVRALCRKGRLRFVRVGERMMIRQSWAEAFIEGKAGAVGRPRRKAGA